MVGLKNFLRKLMMVSLQINNMKPKTFKEKLLHKTFSCIYYLLNKNCILDKN